MEIKREFRMTSTHRYLCVALLTVFLLACEKKETKDPKEPFAPVQVPFEVTGPEPYYKERVQITSYESDGKVESTWKIQFFPSSVQPTERIKWRFSLQNETNYTQEWIQYLGDLDKYREWGMSERIDMPAEYLDLVHDSFKDFISYYDRARGKDLGEERISMVNMDDLSIDYIPNASGHMLHVVYYNSINAFYDYADVKVYLKLLEKRAEISRMLHDIQNDSEQRDLKVESNVEEIFGGK